METRGPATDRQLRHSSRYMGAPVEPSYGVLDDACQWDYQVAFSASCLSPEHSGGKFDIAIYANLNFLPVEVGFRPEYHLLILKFYVADKQKAVQPQES